MAVRTLLVPLVLLVLLYNSPGSLGSSIIGGKDAADGSWPWMVHLNITSDGLKKWRCGGSIVAKQWVLTAAHCWDQNLSVNLRRSGVWVGAHKLSNGAERYRRVTHVVRHPQYQAGGGVYKNDLALLRLDKELAFSQRVAPLSLVQADDTFSPSECFITGWGLVGNSVPLPDPETLQQLQISIVPQSDCRQTYPWLTDDMLCAGSPAGGKDACKGDYGGPLVCRTPRGLVQVGIMSFGSPDGCGLPGRPGVYTRVSSYLDFINSYIYRGGKASAVV
ncbi:tryptase-2 [Oryzias melastigma]|uniref:Tryptase-2-like n=1 Tax=Oryzias melastigma TaxID=30732 RepID=A0A3B3C067_ORYME|nr:tryptase-2 [Oryzias melastigma]